MAAARSPRPARWLVLLVGAAVVVGAYVIGGGLGEPAPTPTAPPSPTPATPPTATAPTEASTEPSARPTGATPSRSAAGSPVTGLRGEAVLTDAVGDVTGAGGDPEPGGPSAADLERVALQGDGSALTITMTLAGDIPPEGESVLWSVELWSGGERAATASVQQVGTRLFSAVYDWSADAQESLATDAAALEDRLLTLRVPAGALAELDGAVTWWALTQRDGGYEDRLPDGGADARVPFPADPG